MKKVDLKKEIAIMNKIQARGESEFSNVVGEDGYVELDNYDGDDESYLGQDNLQGASNRGGVGKINTPQKTINFSVSNNIGIAAFTTKLAAANPSASITLFGATVNTLPGTSGLGITTNNPTYTVYIDGIRYESTPASPANEQDLTVISSTSTYRQIMAESISSPFVIKGMKLFAAQATQLVQAFTTTEVDMLGTNLSRPYTPFDKQSAFQFSPTIIEDREFSLRFDGNSSITYTLYSPGMGGTSSAVSNTVMFNFYLYKQFESTRVFKGGKPMIAAGSNPMPFSAQALKVIK